MGRPKLDIDPSKVEYLASIGFKEKDIAAYFACDPSTIQKRFSRRFQKGLHSFRQELFAAQKKLALAGNPTMQIWLGKQHGQVDSQELTGKDGSPLFPASQVNIFLQESVNIFQQVNRLADPAEREREYALRMEQLKLTRLPEGKK